MAAMVRRGLFITICGVSALLCLLFLGLWVRARFTSDRIVWADVRKQPHAAVDWFNIRTYRSLDVSWDRHTYTGPHPERLDPGGPTRLRWQTLPPSALPLPQQPPTLWNSVGFVLERWRDAFGDDTYKKLRVAVPWWAAVLLTFVVPAWSAIRLFRHRGQRNRRGFAVDRD